MASPAFSSFRLRCRPAAVRDHVRVGTAPCHARRAITPLWPDDTQCATTVARSQLRHHPTAGTNKFATCALQITAAECGWLRTGHRPAFPDPFTLSRTISSSILLREHDTPINHQPIPSHQTRGRNHVATGSFPTDNAARRQRQRRRAQDSSGEVRTLPVNPHAKYVC